MLALIERCQSAQYKHVIHWGPTLQFTGLKESTANILVPDTKAHLQGSSGGHALTGQGCLGSKPTQYPTGGHSLMPDVCIPILLSLLTYKIFCVHENPCRYYFSSYAELKSAWTEQEPQFIMRARDCSLPQPNEHVSWHETAAIVFFKKTAWKEQANREGLKPSRFVSSTSQWDAETPKPSLILTTSVRATDVTGLNHKEVKWRGGAALRWQCVCLLYCHQTQVTCL